MRRSALVLMGVMALPFLFQPVQAHSGGPGWWHPHGQQRVGLSIWWEDGEVRNEMGFPKSITLYENYRRFTHELDITAAVETDTDQGITPIIEEGDMSGLDWTGVHQVDEDWRPDPFDGTYMRTRFYRGARWMERLSLFLLTPLDDEGVPTSLPILTIAGLDDLYVPWLDDGFIRRFNARQIAYGCPEIGNCEGATRFVAQGLMQLRNELNAERPGTSRYIPDTTTQLELLWTEDLFNPRYVQIEHADYDDTEWTYGFEVDPQVVNEPTNGEYFLPGDTVELRANFIDGSGNPLFPDGVMPSYLDFVNDDIPSGFRYYDGLQQLLTLYYAHKHREGLTMWSLAGPTDQLRYPSHVVQTFDFFLPQTDIATVAEDGFSAVSILNPSLPSQADPSLWPLEHSETVSFVVPEDALPGTYVLTVKGRRDWGGEALNRAGVVEIQVGTEDVTGFEPTTGNCSQCHQGDADLENILHGVGDRRTCYSCHSTLAFEPDHALDYRIHLIHTRSDRVEDDPYVCSMCHLDEPEGDPRGFPGFPPI